MNKHEFLAVSGTKRRVFLVDDHPVVREWLTVIINGQIDLINVRRAGRCSPCADGRGEIAA